MWKLKFEIPILLMGYLFIITSNVYSQQLVWTGSANNDFFNESNWQEKDTQLSPAEGIIDPDKAINIDLVINQVSEEIAAVGIINLGSGSLTLSESSVEAQSVQNGAIVFNERAYLELTA